jgi:ABC-type uncharacterized transport system involved in gliding motility auxiliary subunit
VHIDQRMRRKMWVQNGLFVVLFLVAMGLLAYLSHSYQRQWDITQNTRNSLSEATLNTLRQMPGALTITAYATAQDPRLGDVRKLIREFLAPYRRAKPDLTLKFVDPSEQPQAARAAGVEINGEMVVEYRGRSEHLTALNEESVANLLMRLARGSARLIMYLDGHGERKLDGSANHDLGDFGRQLQLKGFKTLSLNLALAQDVPANARVLVIASPRVDVLPGEVAKLKRYLEKGGNLLWLIDQEPLHGLQPLAEQLGLVLTPGTVVDPSAQEQKAPPTWALGASYPQHAITRGFNLITVFPFARQIGFMEGRDWHTTPLVEVAPRGWVENGPLDGTIAFDKNSDIAGPITIGLAMEREREDGGQRVVVIGSGHFLSNSYLGNGGNLDLGVNIVNWLTGDEKLVTIQPKATIDSSLTLTRTSAAVISMGFLVVLPLLLLAAGAVSWWRRRKL